MIFLFPKTKFLLWNKVLKNSKKTNFWFKNMPSFAFWIKGHT